MKKKFKIPKSIKKFADEISGGYWNTRIIKKTDEYLQDYYEMHEVYYKKNGEIWSCTENPIELLFENKEDFGEILRQMVEASEKPILEYDGNKFIETDEIWTERRKK